MKFYELKITKVLTECKNYVTMGPTRSGRSRLKRYPTPLTGRNYGITTYFRYRNTHCGTDCHDRNVGFGSRV